MRRLTALAAFVVSLPAEAQPPPRWTFCVASAASGDEVFMSEVFAVAAPRERLEAAFAESVAALGGSGSSARCPSPRADRAVALEALSEAEKVSRERGLTLRSVSAPDFPGS